MASRDAALALAFTCLCTGAQSQVIYLARVASIPLSALSRTRPALFASISRRPSGGL
jgi:hypothetical protein